jgi:hypothetical protein
VVIANADALAPASTTMVTAVHPTLLLMRTELTVFPPSPDQHGYRTAKSM